MSFGLDSATRQIEAGDTPDFDDNQVSRLIDSGETLAINKGTACFQEDGQIKTATATTVLGFSPFVPIETKQRVDATTEIRGVTVDQFVALAHDSVVSTINPGDLVKISTTDSGTVERWVPNTDSIQERYARYIGKEAGILSQDSIKPFTVSLSTGVIPDQPLLADEIGWFKLIEASGDDLS